MKERHALHSILREADGATSDLELPKYLPEIRHLTKPNPAIFWLDFLLTCTVFYAALFSAVYVDAWSGSQFVLILVAVLAMYRGAVFIHEVQHSGPRIKGFSLAYNLLFGFPNKVPSYAYEPHRQHHSTKSYGTRDDPEYETISDHPLVSLIIPPLVMLVLPFFHIIRWGFTPLVLPLIGERGRHFVFRYLSTMSMNPRYKRPLPTVDESRRWRWQDAGCAIYNVGFLAPMLYGILPYTLFWIWCVVTYLTFVLNYYRVLVAHRYVTGFASTTYKQQVLDSCTITGSLNEWWCPLGLGYHALHHMYPTIPYHNMAAAHQHLLDVLPSDHPYRQTTLPGYFSGISKLLNYKRMREWQVSGTEGIPS